MQIIRGAEGLQTALARVRGGGATLALVPTMGALHAGHLALIEDARTRADKVAASIFVNPLQFNDPADIACYPRHEDSDLAQLEAAGCDLVWLPTADTLYPAGFATTIHVAGVSERWEGAHRPGHFDGVATVVAKLLAAIGPDLAIFGEKDWQQLAVIRRMATDLDLSTRILGYPTVREPDGLAMSSRNALLTPEERVAAGALPAILRRAAARIVAGEKVAAVLADARTSLLAECASEVDYFALVDADTLEPLEIKRENMRILVAARVGTVRLIDNLAVTSEQHLGR